MLDKLSTDIGTAPVDTRMKPLLAYAGKLTEAPSRVIDADADVVYAAGWSEEALVHTIAVCAYFNQMNRLVEGVGIVGSPESNAASAETLVARLSALKLREDALPPQSGLRPRARICMASASALLALSATTYDARAAWPSDKTIRFIVPFAAGGPADVSARVLTQPLGEALGTTIVIENRGGAGGNVGIAAVARSDPDGYTFLVTSGAFSLNPSLYDKAAYDPIVDFEHVSEIAVSANVFVATPASGVTSIPALVAKLRAEPDKHSYATPGAGTQAHFAGELLKIREKVQMAHLSHQGAGPAVQSLLSGAVQFGAMGLPPAQPHIKAGAFTGLAITSARRWPELPDVPTMLELGYKDFVIDVNFLLLAPAKTPKEIVDRVAAETRAALMKPELKQRLTAAGFDVTGLNPAETRAKTIKDVNFWREIVAQTGIKVK